MFASRKNGESADQARFDAQIDALYAAPLNDFVAVRKRLATELKTAGQAAEAQRVGGLAKPNLAAWVTNQTVRRAPDLVQRLLAVTQKLAEIQSAVGRGAQQQDEFQAVLTEQRQIMARLREAAAAVLTEQGRGEGGAVMDQVEKNLRWGPLSGEDRTDFERGRLTHDLSPPGFGALLGSGAGDAGPDSAARTPLKQSPGRTGVADHHHPRHAGPVSAETAAAARTKQDVARERAQAAAEQHARKARLAALRTRLRQASTDSADARRAAARSEQLRSAAAGRVRAVEEQLAAAQSALAAAEEAHQAALAKLVAREAAESALRDEVASAEHAPAASTSPH